MDGRSSEEEDSSSNHDSSSGMGKEKKGEAWMKLERTMVLRDDEDGGK